MRELVTFGWHQTAAQVVNYASRNIDTFIIGLKFGAVPTGLYTRAFQLLSLPLTQVGVASMSVSLPVLSRLQDSPERFNRYLVGGQTILLHSVALLFSFMAAEAAPIVMLAFGAQWMSVIPVFVVLSSAAVFQSANSATQWTLLAKGRAKSLLHFMLLTRSVAIAVIVASSYWGVVGVACGYALSALMIWIVGLVWGSKAAQMPSAVLLSLVVRVVVAYGLCGGFVLLLDRLLPPDEYYLRLGLGALTMAGCLVVEIAIWPRFRKDICAVISMVRMIGSVSDSKSG